MNKEIKEILDEMLWQFEKYPTDDFIVKNKESRILLNYITNLQEENNLLKAKIKCMEEKISYKKAYKDESEIYNEFFK